MTCMTWAILTRSVKVAGSPVYLFFKVSFDAEVSILVMDMAASWSAFLASAPSEEGANELSGLVW